MNDLIGKLIDEIGPGHMGSTAYDTAWTARLGEVDWNLSSRSLGWLAENQLPDGSWGAKAPMYYHDRVLCTLAAMVALTYRGRRGQDKLQIEKGRLALERIVGGATQGLQSDPNGATVGFEMIAPTLAAEAERLGIIKRQGDRILGRLSKQRAKKLAYLKDNMISKNVTIAFSAEMAGTDGKHMLDINNLQENNGSVGLSPSATAYFATYIKKGDEASLKYLHNTVKPDGGLPNVSPFDVFEIAWSLWNLGMIPDLEVTDKLRPHIEFLSKAWEPRRGVSFATNYSVKDSDDSVITYSTLLRFGIEKDLASVLAYEEKDHFRCFDLEVNPSISANIHILHALRQTGLSQKIPRSKRSSTSSERQKMTTTSGWTNGMHQPITPRRMLLLPAPALKLTWSQTPWNGFSGHKIPAARGAPTFLRRKKLHMLCRLCGYGMRKSLKYPNPPSGTVFAG